MSERDDDLRAALHRAAGDVTPSNEAYDAIERAVGARRRRRAVVVLASAVVVAVLGVAGAIVIFGDEDHVVVSTPSPGVEPSTTLAPSTVPPTTVPPTTVPPTTSAPTTSPPTTVAPATTAPPTTYVATTAAAASPSTTVPASAPTRPLVALTTNDRLVIVSPADGHVLDEIAPSADAISRGSVFPPAHRAFAASPSGDVYAELSSSDGSSSTLYRWSKGSWTKVAEPGGTPAVSPDGTLLAYSRPAGAASEVVVRTLATGAERVIAPKQNATNWHQIASLAFSSDNRELAVEYSWEGSMVELVGTDVTTLDDSEAVPIPNGCASRPSWVSDVIFVVAQRAYFPYCNNADVDEPVSPILMYQGQRTIGQIVPQGVVSTLATDCVDGFMAYVTMSDELFVVSTDGPTQRSLGKGYRQVAW
jgi:hypothetical protein